MRLDLQMKVYTIFFLDSCRLSGADACSNICLVLLAGADPVPGCDTFVSDLLFRTCPPNAMAGDGGMWRWRRRTTRRGGEANVREGGER